jgi:hypothetical protein
MREDSCSATFRGEAQLPRSTVGYSAKIVDPSSLATGLLLFVDRNVIRHDGIDYSSETKSGTSKLLLRIQYEGG